MRIILFLCTYALQLIKTKMKDYPKAPSAITRNIQPGQIMTNWKGTKFQVISTDLVPCTLDSIVVREVGDKYVSYYPCDSLFSISEKKDDSLFQSFNIKF